MYIHKWGLSKQLIFFSLNCLKIRRRRLHHDHRHHDHLTLLLILQGKIWHGIKEKCNILSFSLLVGLAAEV